jgi:hypothetical protein
LQHGHFGTGTRGDMRELGGDVAAADHGNARGKLIHLEELVACDHVLGTRKCKRHWPRAGSNEHMAGVNALPVHLDRIASGKAGFSVKSLDAAFRVALFVLLRDRIGEGRLKAMRSRQLIATSPVAPRPRMRRAKSTASAPLISIFFGSHPRRAQVPPNGR